MCLKIDNFVSEDEEKRESELCGMNKAVRFEVVKGWECVCLCVCERAPW